MPLSEQNIKDFLTQTNSSFDELQKIVDLMKNEVSAGVTAVRDDIQQKLDDSNVIGARKNIKEDKKEENLEGNMQRYLDLFNLSKDGYLLFDPTTREVFEVNQAFKDMFEVSNIKEFLLKLRKSYSGFDLDKFKKLALTEQVFLKNDGTQIKLEIEFGDLSDGLSYVSFHNLKNRDKAFKIRDFISKVSEATNLSNGLNEFFKSIHYALNELINAENFYVALYDREKEQINFPYYIDTVDEDVPSEDKLGRGLTEYVIRTREAIIVDKEKFKELKTKGEVDLVGEPAESWLGVPLFVDGRVKGVIVAQSYDENIKYKEEDRQIFSFISQEIANKLALVELKEKEKKDMDILKQREAELVKLNEEFSVSRIELMEKVTELEKIQGELAAKNTELYKLFGIITHDLRSPMQGILGVTEFINEALRNNSEILKSVKALPEDFIPDTPGGIFELSKELENLVNLYLEKLLNLLSWAKFKLENNIEQKKESIDLRELINSIFLKMNKNLKDKEIRVMNKLKEGDVLMQDKGVLNMIFDNLLTNAIKFSHQKGVIIVDKHESTNEYIVVKVSDSGVGMRPDQLANIFILGKSVSTEGTKGEKGTGLGLPLSKEYLEAIGGQISVSSKPNHGTTFFVRIPKK